MFTLLSAPVLFEDLFSLAFIIGIVIFVITIVIAENKISNLKRQLRELKNQQPSDDCQELLAKVQELQAINTKCFEQIDSLTTMLDKSLERERVLLELSKLDK
jgi:predicted PurR-regulated permease PerM